MFGASLTSVVGFVGILGTSLFSVWAVLRYILLGTYRLSGDTSKRMIDKIMKDSSWKWVLSGELVEPPRYPETFESIVIMGGAPFFFARSERLLTAGWKSKEDVSSIIFLRWQRKKIETILSSKIGYGNIPICALTPSDPDRLGELTPDPDARVYLNEGSYEDIEEDVRKLVNGEINKTSCLLYGAPGNGKSQFVKYLAKKYTLPIYVVYLNPDYDNLSVARMFSEIPRRCIVLMEDFDTLFTGRDCSMKNDQVRFTFDSIINALDGVHNDYRGVVFVMTANEVSKIDDSLKKRPSRFKYVREFSNPDSSLRMKILNDETAVKETEGMTLDSVFSYSSNL